MWNLFYKIVEIWTDQLNYPKWYEMENITSMENVTFLVLTFEADKHFDATHSREIPQVERIQSISRLLLILSKICIEQKGFHIELSIDFLKLFE